jgi:hypothetical protein
MTEKKTEKRPTILLMYVGRYIGSDGKSEGRKFYHITQDEWDAGVVPESKPAAIGSEGAVERAFALASNPWAERERFYSGKRLAKYMGGSPGMVYRVEVDPEDASTIYTATAQYVGVWPDQKQRAEWQMLDSTVGQKIALMKKAKKAKNQDDVLECLEPIREAYRKARGMQRSLILARAVQYITR